MQVYEVGGAVRDALLGEPVTDRDWVVVGATPQQMVDAGYRPVGRDFPVFLHPATHEEYALARTERKSGRGYHGFVVHAAPDVTLEEDLARRDLTVNAMARAADGTIVDPFGGRRDLAEGVLRHVSPAFAEDPVRLLRLARFAARWPRFRVADETMALLRELVRAGEVDALVPERVWQELARGLGEARPSRMLEVLRDSGALARLLPEVDELWADDDEGRGAAMALLTALDEAARCGAPRPVRFALLALDPRAQAAQTSDRAQRLCDRWRVPNEERELAMLVGREAGALRRSSALDAEGLVRLFDRCDAWRRPQRFEQAVQASECADRAGAGAGTPQPDRLAGERLRRAWRLARTVDARAVSAAAIDQGQEGPQIARALFAARRQAVDTGLTPG